MMMQSPDRQAAQPAAMVSPKKVRVSSLLSSDVLLSKNGNNENDNNENDRENERDDNDQDSTASSSGSEDQVPSVIATYSRSDSSPFGEGQSESARYLIDAIGDDDESGTLIDSIERDELADDSSLESSVDDTELELEDEGEEEEEDGNNAGAEEDDDDDDKEVEITIEALGDGIVSTNQTGGPAVVTMAASNQQGTNTVTKVKSLINTLGTAVMMRNAIDTPSQNSNDNLDEKASFMPVLKAFLSMLLIPMCSYVLREATLVTRDVSLGLREKGIMENLILLHFMVALNMLFSLFVFVGVAAVFWDPSRLRRFVSSLETSRSSS